MEEIMELPTNIINNSLILILSPQFCREFHLILTRIRLTPRGLDSRNPHTIIQSILYHPPIYIYNLLILIPILHMQTMPCVTQLMKHQSPRAPQITILQIMRGIVPFPTPAFRRVHSVTDEPLRSRVEASISCFDR